MAAKPFSPEEVQRILGSLHGPAVFINMTSDWPVLHWTVEHLSHCLGQKTVRFRMGRKLETHTPLFETQCSYVEASLGQFLCWVSGDPGLDSAPFSDYPLQEYWAYADYKYIAMLFQEQPSLFQDVRWCEFGYPGRGGRESTLWIGTEGANTPCHLDSYGRNLVLQVQGRKRWHLFPPEDAERLYPSRIPYEESSVFSLVDVLRPDLGRHPAFTRARAHVITLLPGQVLFVPRHWWHYVESLDPVTVSVNTWTELEVDDEARVGEALTKTVVCALKAAPSEDNHDDWLNPTEEDVPSHTENLQYLTLAVQACLERRERSRRRDPPSPRPGGPGAAKRDSRGQTRTAGAGSSAMPFTVPFGPHLVAVPPDQDRPQDPRGHAHRDRETEPSDHRVAGPSRAQSSRPDSGAQISRPHPDSGAPSSRPDSGAQSSRPDRAAQSSRPDRAAQSSRPDRAAQSRAGGASAPGEGDCRSPVRELGSGDTADVQGHSPISTNDLLECLEAQGHAPISTNDLLECLVHPDVITRVTELLLERQSRSHNSSAS